MLIAYSLGGISITVMTALPFSSVGMDRNVIVRKLNHNIAPMITAASKIRTTLFLVSTVSSSSTEGISLR